MDLTFTESDLYSPSSFGVTNSAGVTQRSQEVFGATQISTESGYGFKSSSAKHVLSWSSLSQTQNKEDISYSQEETLSTEGSKATDRSFKTDSAAQRKELKEQLEKEVGEISLKDMQRLLAMRPSEDVRLIGIAFLVLFVEVDSTISLKFNYKILLTKAWDSFAEWIAKTSRSFFYLQKLPELLREGKISSKTVTDVKDILRKVRRVRFSGIVEKIATILDLVCCIYPVTRKSSEDYERQRPSSRKPSQDYDRQRPCSRQLDVPKTANRTGSLPSGMRGNMDQILLEIAKKEHETRRLLAEQRKADWDEKRQYKRMINDEARLKEECDREEQIRQQLVE